MRNHTLLPATAWMLLVAAIVPVTAIVGRADAPAASAVELSLARGEQYLVDQQPQRALAEARQALDRLVDDPRLLDLVSRAAEASGDHDLAIVYARHAIDLLARRPRGSDSTRRFVQRIHRLDPLDGEATRALDRHLDDLFALAEYARRSRLHANAIDLYSRLADTPIADRATRQLARLIEDPRVVEALVLTDLRIPPPASASDLSDHERARRDASHATWETAERLASRNYVVVTNAGHEKGAAVLQALDFMNTFYREFFAPVELNAIPTPCEIRLYRTRAEYQRRESVGDPSIEAFFDPRENVVATFDPTSIGLPFSDLWETLFHEASHQFTDRLSYDVIPGWLHEGTSTYFEGATLLPGGGVRTNGIPGRRLDALLDALDRGKPTLRDVLSFGRARSYPRQYYSIGWGLVYFLWNYEDENAQPVYREPYLDFLRAHRRPTRMVPVERFKRHFITGPARAGIVEFEDFERLFEAWIRDLADIHDGPPGHADRLIEKARLQFEQGRLDAARQSLQWALRKRPDDIIAHHELGRTMEALGNVDGAILGYRRVLSTFQLDSRAGAGSVAGKATARQLAAHARERIRKLNRIAGEKLSIDETPIVEAVVRAVRDLRAKGFDGFARLILDDATAVLGAHPRLIAVGSGTTSALAAETRRWRRLGTLRRLEAWDGAAATAWSSSGSTRVSGTTDILRTLLHRDTPSLPYRFEATVSIADGAAQPRAAGIAFAASFASGLHRMWIDATGNVVIGAPERGPGRVQTLAGLSADLRRHARLAVEIAADGRVRFFADNVQIGERRYPADSLGGRIGLLLEGGTATFKDMRVLY